MRTRDKITSFACMAALFAVMALPAYGGATATLLKNRIAASKPVVPGEWHASLSKCKAYADAHGVPLIAVWSNGDLCGHCVQFESACNHKTFRNWMKKSGCVFFFIYSGDPGGYPWTLFRCDADASGSGTVSVTDRFGNVYSQSISW